MKKLTIFTICVSLIVFAISFQYAYAWSKETFKFEVQEDPYSYIEAYYKK